MSVTKRTRYEVLRRDNYTCRYCHSTTSELTVDHVIPKALGGSDDASNLVAACRDCNAGKTSTKPDDHLVAEVSEQAVALAAALKTALARRGDEIAEDRLWAENVQAWWDDSADSYDCPWAAMDDGWEQTVIRWRNLGVPANVITDAIDKAMSRRKVTASQKWKYTCGIVWNIIREAVDETTGHSDATPQKCGHCWACLHPEAADEEEGCVIYHALEAGESDYECPICHRYDCLYGLGMDDGMQDEYRRLIDRLQPAIDHYKTCPEVDR
ncbi:HNH endonuclease [Actinomyces procaprae]|uniref:HNH endonuclease n=1 Tax=Actinomyces procaprae TaxID=2560010 RepID=UPI0010A24900|nr:HNH endonuclease [Actinomyces procaprae]